MTSERPYERPDRVISTAIHAPLSWALHTVRADPADAETARGEASGSAAADADARGAAGKKTTPRR